MLCNEDEAALTRAFCKEEAKGFVSRLARRPSIDVDMDTIEKGQRWPRF